MIVTVVGSGNSENILQKGKIYFANSSVVRCQDKTIGFGVVSAGIIDSDEHLYAAPIQNYGDRDTAFRIRKTKRNEILSKYYQTLYLIGPRRYKTKKENHVKKATKCDKIIYMSHRECYFLYIKVLLLFLMKNFKSRILYLEIVRIILQCFKLRIDKPSTGICALIIALKNNPFGLEEIKLNGIGNQSEKSFYYSSKLDVKNITWNNFHEETDQKILTTIRLFGARLVLN
jgi:hypothetical protein